jgi:hypothetical protein
MTWPAVFENVVIIGVATGLAIHWDSGWPFLLMLFCNTPRKIEVN